MRIILLTIFLFFQIVLLRIFVIWRIQCHKYIALSSSIFSYFLSLFNYDTMPISWVILQPGSEIESIFNFAISSSLPLRAVCPLFKTRIQITRWVDTPFGLLILNYLWVYGECVWWLVILNYSCWRYIFLLWIFIFINFCKPSEPFELTLQPLSVFNCVKAASEVSVIRFGHGTRCHSLQILKNGDELGLHFHILTESFRVSHLGHHPLKFEVVVHVLWHHGHTWGPGQFSIQ
jgi:hypothetical protein